MSKCNIICTLTPDAVNLLKLVKADGNGVDFEEIGHVNGHGAKAPKVHATRTINGVKFQKYVKKGTYMTKHTVLALGTLPKKLEKKNLGKSYAAIAMKMQATPEYKGLPTITHERASEVLKPLFKDKCDTYIPGRIGDLFRIGALRVVL